MSTKPALSFNCPEFTVGTEDDGTTNLVCPHFALNAGESHISFNDLNIRLPKPRRSRSAASEVEQLQNIQQFYDLMRMFIAQKIAEAQKKSQAERQDEVHPSVPVPIFDPNFIRHQY